MEPVINNIRGLPVSLALLPGVPCSKGKVAEVVDGIPSLPGTPVSSGELGLSCGRER